MNKKRYSPINCSFHDVLLDRASRKVSAELKYSTEQGEEETIRALIVDVFTQDQEEFLSLETTAVIRLDYIISLDGIKPSDYEAGGHCAIS